MYYMKILQGSYIYTSEIHNSWVHVKRMANCVSWVTLNYIIFNLLTLEYLLLAWILVISCLLLETSFVTCWRYLDIISSNAFWCSSKAALSSLFSCCNSRRWRFSCCIPATSTVCGRWRAVSLSSPTSSWYC